MIALKLPPSCSQSCGRLPSAFEKIETGVAARAARIEMLGDAHAEEAWIGEEDVGGQAGIIAVQEIAGDGGGVEDILHIAHHLPAGRIASGSVRD